MKDDNIDHIRLENIDLRLLIEDNNRVIARLKEAEEIVSKTNKFFEWLEGRLKDREENKIS
jgi:hypothetical protein